MKYLFLLIIFLTFTFAVSAQCTDLDDCNSKLSRSAQQINKLLEVNTAQETELKAKDAELATVYKALGKAEGVIESKDSVIKAKDETITVLREIKCSRSSFLLFVYKSKRCY